MCRNIKTLYNFEPSATNEEIRAASIQYVRKISGFTKPSEINTQVFNKAIEEISLSSKNLIASLETNASPKNREVEAEKARERNRKRFGNK